MTNARQARHKEIPRDIAQLRGSAVFERLTAFVKELIDPTALVTFAPDDPRLSVAALLFHAVAVDGVITAQERAGVHGVISRLYGLDERASRHVVEEGMRRAQGAVDSAEFVQQLARRLSPAEKREVVEALWEVVMADGIVHEFEEDVVWRIAEPLGVGADDREALRQKAAGRPIAGPAA